MFRLHHLIGFTACVKLRSLCCCKTTLSADIDTSKNLLEHTVVDEVPTVAPCMSRALLAMTALALLTGGAGSRCVSALRSTLQARTAARPHNACLLAVWL